MDARVVPRLARIVVVLAGVGEVHVCDARNWVVVTGRVWHWHKHPRRCAAVRAVGVVGAPCAHARDASDATVLADAIVGHEHELVVAVGRADCAIDADPRGGGRRWIGRHGRRGRRQGRRGRRWRRWWAGRRRRVGRRHAKLVRREPERAQVVLRAQIVHEPLRTAARAIVRTGCISATCKHWAWGARHSRSRWSRTARARRRWGAAWSTRR